jgi:hypothetical protein
MGKMTEYHKIDTVYKRDPATKHKSLIVGDYSRPEFAYLADNEWVFTEKVDGTNIRVFVDAETGQIGFGGRTDDAQMPTRLGTALVDLFRPLEATLVEQFPSGAVLYGEGYGATIQKGGGNYRPDQGFVLFDIRVGDWWLERPTVEEIATQFKLDIAPIIGRGTLGQMVERAAAGIRSQWGPFDAEGIVARPATELRGRDGKRIITKIKHRDFSSVEARLTPTALTEA